MADHDQSPFLGLFCPGHRADHESFRHESDDFRVNCREVGSAHTGLTRTPCRNDDELCALESGKIGATFDLGREPTQARAMPHVQR